MNPIKFYRVETLPEVGEVGGLYFVYKGASPKFYVCTANGFEQYSDLFSRNFSTLLVDAIANAGDGVVYFTPDTHLIIKDGVSYGAPQSISNEFITEMVLGTTSLQEAYLNPFDDDIANQLNDIIYGTDTTEA